MKTEKKNKKNERFFTFFFITIEIPTLKNTEISS